MEAQPLREGLYGQRLSEAGEPEGGRITLASPPNVKVEPSGIARGATGEAYLIWRSAEQSYGYGIMGQRYASPQGSFTATAVAPVGTMVFSDTSTSPLAITSWLWTFGDGITSTLQNPTHVYSPTGLYTVTLTITSGTEWDLGTQVITVPSTLPIPLQTTVITYTYDGLRRLTEAERNTGEVYTYTYDLVGNRLSAWEDGVSRAWSYTATDQVVGWSYDAVGNLTNDGSQTYTYNALNHMTGATPTSGPGTTYAYNGDGVLVAQTTGTTTTHFTQDLQAPLSQMLAVNDGTTTTQYIYGYERLAEQAGSTQTWPIHDALGSVRATLDSTGLPLTATTYDPWGQPSGGTQPSPFGFTGEYQNQGLVYLRARWYQPENGRFTGRDPFAGRQREPRTLAKYPYAENDPVNKFDPTGKVAAFFGGSFSAFEDKDNPGTAQGGDEVGMWGLADQVRNEGLDIGPIYKYDDSQSATYAFTDIFLNTSLCEPVIIVGHSRGARIAYDVVNGIDDTSVQAMRSIDPQLFQKQTVDLLVTVGLAFEFTGGYDAKPPQVIKHINFYTIPNESFWDGARTFPTNEAEYIEGAENIGIGMCGPHANIDDKLCPNGTPNYLWERTLKEIHDIWLRYLTR